MSTEYAAPVLGLTVAIFGGGVAAWAFAAATSRSIGLPSRPADVVRIQPWLTGVIERCFFFTLVVILPTPDGMPEAMVGWLAIKLALNWRRVNSLSDPYGNSRGLLALLTGAVSLGFAYLGGAIFTSQFPIGG